MCWAERKRNKTRAILLLEFYNLVEYGGGGGGGLDGVNLQIAKKSVTTYKQMRLN